MSEAKSSDYPVVSLNRDELVNILDGLSDYIGVHQVVLDEFGAIVDAHLVWWNDSFEKIRNKQVVVGQSMAETYFEPWTAFAYVTEAWDTGQSLQLFEMTASTRDKYRAAGSEVCLLVNWQRVGDYIVEAGGDLSEYIVMQKLLLDQKSLVAIASKKRALAIERQRIAHNLHDSVIQQLYATSLGLSMATRDADEETTIKIGNAIDAIANVIDGIRREILDVESKSPSSLMVQLEDILLPIISPAEAEFEIIELIPRLNDEFFPHVRAVCSEATSNAIRHGKANKVWISLERRGGQLHLIISDNGSGIDPNAPLRNGLNNMRQRAQSMGGTMKIEAREGGGTVLIWAVPHPGWAS
jgi:signal transduction histidine kinase